MKIGRGSFQSSYTSFELHIFYFGTIVIPNDDFCYSCNLLFYYTTYVFAYSILLSFLCSHCDVQSLYGDYARKNSIFT